MDPAGIDPPRARPDAADVCEAEHVFKEARARLDSAVARIPKADGDDAMATPELLLLLASAVRAKERVDALEALLSLDGDHE
jgi:hypothetical protein